MTMASAFTEAQLKSIAANPIGNHFHSFRARFTDKWVLGGMSSEKEGLINKRYFQHLVTTTSERYRKLISSATERYPSYWIIAMEDRRLLDTGREELDTIWYSFAPYFVSLLASHGMAICDGIIKACYTISWATAANDHRNINTLVMSSLLWHVVDNHGDNKIWSSAFDFLRGLHPRSLPALRPPSLTVGVYHCDKNTIFELHHDLDKALIRELDQVLDLDIDDFFNELFGNKRWTHDSDGLLQSLRKTNSRNPLRWKNQFPGESQRHLFHNVVNDSLSAITRVYQYRYYMNCIAGPENADVAHLVALHPAVYVEGRVLNELQNSPLKLERSIVVGIIASKSSRCEKEMIIRVATAVRDMFNLQPRRRFIHAFTLQGEYMQCWVFHRSGGMGSKLVDIRLQPQLFLKVMIGYSSMSDAELGFDTTITLGHLGTDTIEIKTPNGELEVFEIHKEPIRRSSTIVGRGTVYWRARKLDHSGKETEWSYMVKDSWRTQAHYSEATFMQRVKQEHRWVIGVGQYYASQDIELPNVTNGIKAGICRGLQGWKTGLLRSSYGGRFRMSDTEGEKFHSRIVLSTVGRSLYDYDSLQELLLALRDAIRGHRYLHDAGILHRNISVYNIMITDRKGYDEPYGFISNLDLATRLGSTEVFENVVSMGASAFVATELLRSPKRTPQYMHDLESFLYVLLWLCICTNGPRGSRPATTSEQSPDDLLSILRGLDVQTSETPNIMPYTSFRKMEGKFSGFFQQADIWGFVNEIRMLVMSYNCDGTEDHMGHADEIYKMILDEYDVAIERAATFDGFVLVDRSCPGKRKRNVSDA